MNAEPTVHIIVPEKSPAVAYLLWFLCLFGLCGIHRFYSGRWVTGIIWLLTGGLLFVGQLIDLFLIPGIVRIANIETRLLASANQPRHM